MANVVECNHKHRSHAVGAVDEGEAFLFAEFNGLDASRRECLAARHLRARRIANRSFAHEGERAVGERRQVTGASERTVFVNNRRNPRVENRGVGLDNDWPHSRSSGHER